MKTFTYVRAGSPAEAAETSMLAEDDGLYVLHRRNLTKISERNGVPDRFDRVFALPHGIADTYDMAYGLARSCSATPRTPMREWSALGVPSA